MAESKPKPYLLTFFMSSSAASFFLHYAWEKFQCSPYFIHGAGQIGTAPMVAAALGDLVLTWLAYATVAVSSHSWRWVVDPWRFRQWAIVIGLALAFSIGLEFVALNTERWRYTTENPVIPILGVSVLSVLQLLILFPLSFVMWRSVLKRMEFRRLHC